MKTLQFVTAAMIVALAVCTIGTASEAPPKYKMTTDIPPQLTTPDTVETSIGTLEFFDGVPVGNTKETLFDFVDRGRAVEAFINMTPAASMYSLRQGHRDFGLNESHQIMIAEQLGDSKPLVLTWNNTSLYTWGFLDLAKDGPTVIEIPPDVLGILDDMYFRYISDMGAAGPDKGKGGKYLILPPGYEGEVPDGYYVVQSQTYTVWNFMRGYVRGNVQDPANVKRAADNIKANLKVYPLSRKDNPPKMEFKNMSGLAGYNTIMPNDFSFFEVVHEIVQEEADGWLDPELMGQLRAIGIVKGQPFNPDARMKKILTDAVAIGNAYARVNTVYPKDPGNYIYKDVHTEWVMAYPDKDTYFLKDGGRRMDGRLWMHYNAVCVTPAMALTRPGAGSDYMITGLDSEGRPLDGAKTYKLHLPPNFPVKDNWSVTIYDPQTRSMLQTDQTFAGINSLSADQKKNTDGSIDVFFAPETPPGMEKNWIQTIPGKSWFILLRAYGPLQPWIDKTWRPSQLELVE